MGIIYYYDKYKYNIIMSDADKNDAGDKADEESPMMEDEAKEETEKEESDNKSTASSGDDPVPKDILSPCCCCLCVCSNEFTEDRSCCGCFPIKCGVVTIGIFTFILTLVLVCWNFFLFLNDYIHWWFTFIVLLLYIPLILGAAFFVCWFTEDTKGTRTMIMTSCILIIVSLVLVVSWYLIYFIWIYKRDGFYQGMGDPKDNVYSKSNKKTFLFTFLGETVGLLALYSYFLCVTTSYKIAMHGPETPAEEKAASSKKSESKKDEGEMMDGEMEEAAAE